MKVLIPAAGEGRRLKGIATSKPLHPLLGVPILERVIRAALEAGGDRFVVVVGYQKERLIPFLEDLGRRLSVPIATVENPLWSESDNGDSILCAQPLLEGEADFLLLMADHLVSPELIRRVVAEPLPQGAVRLGVDFRLDNPYVDVEDATKVKVEDGRIVAISKKLSDYNGYDCGVFHATPALFQALRQAKREGKPTTLSEAVTLLAERGQALAAEIDGAFWIDLDDPKQLQKAERFLLDRLRNKPTDGPVSRYLNRPVSIRISRYLVTTSVTPNQISLLSFLLTLLGSVAFALGGYPGLFGGALLAQLASILDGCDGEIARLKFLQSELGAWFDAVLDRYGDAALILGLGWSSWPEAPERAFWVTAMALVGTFLLSYTADKYDGYLRKRGGAVFRIGRDVRVLMIALGALLNQPFWTLLLIAVLMNLEVVRRVWVLTREG